MKAAPEGTDRGRSEAAFVPDPAPGLQRPGAEKPMIVCRGGRARKARPPAAAMVGGAAALYRSYAAASNTSSMAMT